MMKSISKSQVLKSYWGYDSFRGNQEEIIDSILNGYDTLALMATGGGKSLCYQLPALIKEGICIVISPLIALMEDQEKNLLSMGVKAISIHSGKSRRIQDQLFDNCIYGKVKFLFLSPEKLSSDIALARIQQMNISFFVIDEAHCISQWGHDFRPSYLKTKLIKEHFPKQNIIALTATATTDVVNDIIEQADFSEAHKVFSSSFYRPNISISVMKTVRKDHKIIQLVSKINGSKIIYARNKRHCEEINQILKSNGISSNIYHADIPIKERMQRQTDWLQNKISCIVCTSAFGMGIDKADVRLVIHNDIPPSLEEYIQEIGRAGRDGEQSYAVLLYNNYDLKELEFYYLNSIPKLKEIKEFYKNLSTYLNIALGDGKDRSFEFNLNLFVQKYKFNKTQIRSILQILEKSEILVSSDTIFSSDKVKIIAGKQTLNNFLHDDSEISTLVKHLLRVYEGLLYSFVSVSIENIATKLNWKSDKVILILNKAEKLNLLYYKHENAAKYITFKTERLPIGNLLIDHKALAKLNRSKKIKYESVIDYIIDENCRALDLLEYFGENKKENCMNCDVCLGTFNKSYTAKELNDGRNILLSNLSKAPLKLDDMIDLVPWNKQAKIKEILKYMLDEGSISLKNEYFTLVSNK